MPLNKVTITSAVAQSRAKLDLWSQLLKCGEAPLDALKRVGIEDLEATIARSELCNADADDEHEDDDDDEIHEDVGEDVSVEETSINDDEIAERVNEIIDQVAMQDIQNGSQPVEESSEGVRKEEDQTDSSSKTAALSEEIVHDMKESGDAELDDPKLDDRSNEPTADASRTESMENTIDVAELPTIAISGENADGKATNSSTSEGAATENTIDQPTVAVAGDSNTEGKTKIDEGDAEEEKPVESDEDSESSEEEVVDISFDETEEKNFLAELVDWLLSEAEYCSHTLLMARGNVLVTPSGDIDKKLLWTPRGHVTLTEADHATESAQQRLNTALEALSYLTNCPSIRSWSFPWKERYRVVNDMLSAFSGDTNIERLPLDLDEEEGSPASSALVRPFYDMIADKSGSHDLYLLKNGLPHYVDALSRLLEQMKGFHWNLNILNALNDASNMLCDVQQIYPLVENLAAAKKITDIRVSRAYLKLFRTAFGNLGFDDKKRVMELFYDKHGPVAWHENDDEFGTNLTAAINNLHVQRSKKEPIRKLAKEFCWFFMLSVKYTWRRLLVNDRGQIALNNPALIPIIADILRTLPPVKALRISGNGERLLLAGVRSLVKDNLVTSEEYESNWIRIVCSLLSQKMSMSKKDDIYMAGIETSVIDMTEGISSTVLPLLASHTLLGLKLLVALLNCGPANSIKWSGEAPASDTAEKWSECGVNVAKLISTIAEIFAASKKRHTPDAAVVSKLCLDLQSLLSVEWESADLLLTPDAVQWIERRFDTPSSSWAPRCWMFWNLRHLSNGMMRLPVPQCLFETFQLPGDKFKKTDCEDWSTDHKKFPCALQSLFQLANFPNGVVREIFKVAKFDGFLEEIKKGKLGEPLTDALVAVLSDRHTAQEWRECTEVLMLLFDQMKEECGESFEEGLSTGLSLTGFRVISPAAKICEAVARIVKKSPILSATYTQNFAVVCNDIIVERVLPLDDATLKFDAWRVLFGCYCKLVRAVGRKSAESHTNAMLRCIVENMNQEMGNSYMAIFSEAANFIGGDTKELILKKLGNGAENE